MHSIELVIFDFDGVLVDSEVISLSELNQSFEHFGIGKSWQELADSFLGLDTAKLSSYIEEQSGEQSSPEFPENWTKRVLDRFATDLTLIPDTEKLLDLLDAHKLDYCIASGSSPERLNFALKTIGLEDRFAGRAFSADLVRRGKPAPDIFLHAMEKMGKSPQKSMVVEDGTAGVMGARAAGIASVIGFVGGSHLEGCEASHGTKLTECGAGQIVSTMENLRQVLAL